MNGLLRQNQLLQLGIFFTLNISKLLTKTFPGLREPNDLLPVAWPLYECKFCRGAGGATLEQEYVGRWIAG